MRIRIVTKREKERCGEMDMKIGLKITELRKKKGMTQEQLAAALGVSAPAVSKWETDLSHMYAERGYDAGCRKV